MGEYLPLVQEMLDGTAHALAESKLPPEHFDVFRNLVLTTAWQESCWRQYSEEGPPIEAMRGPGADRYGLMQVNARVWRGIYDPKGVSTDIGYNGRAGAEILYQYLRKHALAGKEHMEPGGDPTSRAPPGPRTTVGRATCAATGRRRRRRI